MDTVTTSNRRTTSRPTTTHNRVRTGGATRREAPMPRSTTRVFWTSSSGAVVMYGEVR
jgi:hypothetical protein